MSSEVYYERMRLADELVIISARTMQRTYVAISVYIPRTGERFAWDAPWPFGKPRTEFALAEIICDVEDAAAQCAQAVASRSISAYAVFRVAVKDALARLS